MPHPFRSELIRLTDPAARMAWNALLAESPQRSAAAQLAFADAVEAVHGWAAHLAGVWDGDRLAAGALVYEKRLGPYRAAALSPLAPYASPLLAAPLSEAAVHSRSSPLDALLDLLAERFHQTSLVLDPSLTDARPFTWHGARASPAYTYRLALSPDHPVEREWSDNPQRTLKKHSGVYDVRAESGSTDEVVGFVAASYDRQGEEGKLPAEAGAFARRMVEAGLARPFIARHDGQAEAGVLVLSDGRTAHYWLAGSLPGPAMTVLLADVLRQLAEEGVTTFDFAGANTPSIAEFKRRLGGVLTPYFRVRLSSRPELQLLDAVLARF